MIKIISNFFNFLGDYKKDMKQAIIYSLLNSIFVSFEILAIYTIINAIITKTVSPTTALISFLIMLLSLVGSIFTKHNAIMRQANASFYMCAQKRTDIGDRMKSIPMGYFNDNSLGEITSIITTTLEDLQDIAPRVIDKTINGFIHAIVISIMMMFFDYRIGIIIISVILLFVITNSLLQQKSKKISPQRVNAQSKLVGAVLEYILGISVIRSFNLIKDANNSINNAIDDCEKQNIKLELTFIPYIFIQTFILNIGSISIVITSIILYLNNTMNLSITLMMLVSSFIIFSQLNTAGSISSLLRCVETCLEKITSFNNTPIMDENGISFNNVNHDISIKDVSFSYNEKKIINNLNFEIKEKTTTAIVGPSGSGKTTICNLLTRFWDVDSGSIQLGNKDIRKYSLNSLLNNFSMVFQNVYLFNDTIENNIKFGKADASLNEIRMAAKKACCDEFIMKLPDGYNTIISESGSTLSGGEKQRISIARAILKDAPIIILDKATANVDPENENKLQDAIEELTLNKTIIMIAHRLKTVKNADQIIVLDQGNIVEKGKHSNLIKNNGLYADFINSRRKSVGWKI